MTKFEKTMFIVLLGGMIGLALIISYYNLEISNCKGNLEKHGLQARTNNEIKKCMTDKGLPLIQFLDLTSWLN